MKKIQIYAAAAVALSIAIVGHLAFQQRESSDIQTHVTQSLAPSTTVATANPTAPNIAAPAEANKTDDLPVLAIDADEPSEDPTKMFKADANGQLIVSEQARLNVEKLHALYTAEEQQQKLNAIQQSLPASAYRDLVDLLDKYKNFSTALKQSYPPGVAPSTMEDAKAQQDGLHALRVAHFGAERAEAMFGREERIAKQLLEFMKLEQHQGLTMEDKAEKAQQMLLKSPDLLAAYEANRKTGEQPN